MTATAIVAAIAAGLAVSAWPGATAQEHDDAFDLLDVDVDDAVDEHADVDEARQRVEDARAEAAELAERLDHATARYEHARAHLERLAHEADEAARAVADAEAAAAGAEAAFAEVAAVAYRQPGAAFEAGHAVLASTRRRDVAHRAVLVERVVVAEQREAHRLAAHADRVADARRQHQVVRAGVAEATADAADAAAALEAATADARDHADRAAAALDATEADVRQRLAAEQQAQRRELVEQRRRDQRGQQASGRGRTVLPSDAALADMACPVAEPNAFVDSWHFPRSSGRVHLGVDMFADHGVALYAVADGTVRRVWNNRLGGLSIDLIDQRGDRYYYAHLSAAHVRAGESVRAGQHIGANGNSGNARHTPPHLHWQYHPGDGDAVNPYPLAATLCR